MPAMAATRLPRGIALKGQFARHHAVEHDAQGPKIRAPVDLGLLDLLGRDIRYGAHGQARRGDFRSLRQTSDAEIQDANQAFRPGRLRDHQVRWFDVAMDDLLAVRRGQAPANLDGDLDRHVDLQRAVMKLLGERLPVEISHRNKGPAGGLVNVVNRADVGMIERGRGLGLTLEALHPVGMFTRCGARNLRATTRSRLVSSARGRPATCRPRRSFRECVS